MTSDRDENHLQSSESSDPNQFVGHKTVTSHVVDKEDYHFIFVFLSPEASDFCTETTKSLESNDTILVSMEKLSVLAVFPNWQEQHSEGIDPRKIELVFVNLSFNSYLKPVEKKTVFLAREAEEIKGLHPPLLAWLKPGA